MDYFINVDVFLYLGMVMVGFSWDEMIYYGCIKFIVSQLHFDYYWNYLILHRLNFSFTNLQTLILFYSRRHEQQLLFFVIINKSC